MLKIEKATKEQIKLRMAIDGPTGSGKTYTALRFAHRLSGQNGAILVIDSERRSASKYVGENPDGTPWAFDVINLPTFSPSTYTEAVRMAGKEGYDVVIIDSLSHAWMGRDGALEQVDRANTSGGKFAAWRNVTPQHNAMIDAILDCPAHVIVTMRSKMEYAMEETEENGKRKTVVQKLGMAPIQRSGVEYEFDVVIDMDATNTAYITKSRCSAINGETVFQPTGAFIEPLVDWLNEGEPAKWTPSKETFFGRVKDELKVDYNDAVTLLKSLEFTGYNPTEAQAMYEALKGEITRNGPLPAKTNGKASKEGQPEEAS